MEPYDDIPDRMRRCIATQEILDTDKMIRFVVGPDGAVVPDIKCVLPGRGMWVRASRKSLEIALSKSMFSRSAKHSVKASNDLPENVEKVLRRRILDTLSLARRAGFASVGADTVKDMLKGHRCACVLSSATGGTDNDTKMRGMCRMLTVPYVSYFDRHELGKIFGRDGVTFAGIEKCGISETITNEVKRLTLFIDGE